MAGRGRVEHWRGSFRYGELLFPGGFRHLPVPQSVSSPRFQCPLIKPDMQISCIRLSDKASCIRPQTVVRQRLDIDQSELLVEVLIREA